MKKQLASTELASRELFVCIWGAAEVVLLDATLSAEANKAARLIIDLARDELQAIDSTAALLRDSY